MSTGCLVWPSDLQASLLEQDWIRCVYASEHTVWCCSAFSQCLHRRVKCGQKPFNKYANFLMRFWSLAKISLQTAAEGWTFVKRDVSFLTGFEEVDGFLRYCRTECLFSMCFWYVLSSVCYIFLCTPGSMNNLFSDCFMEFCRGILLGVRD